MAYIKQIGAMVYINLIGTDFEDATASELQNHDAIVWYPHLFEVIDEPTPTSGYGILNFAVGEAQKCEILRVKNIDTQAEVDALEAIAPINADWSAVDGAAQILNKPILSSVATSGSYNDLSNKPASRSHSAVTRSNVAFQISTTRDALVSYSVDVSVTLSLTSGQTGNIFLEISPDSSSWTEIGRFTNANTGALTVGLNLTQVVTGTVSGYVPAGYYARLRNTGSGSFVYRSGQEVLL